MRRWSSFLEAELMTWPGVSANPMFGFLSFYRAGRIFAALPAGLHFVFFAYSELQPHAGGLA